MPGRQVRCLPVGIYKINASTLSAQETFVIIQKDASANFSTWTFSGSSTALTISTTQTQSVSVSTSNLLKDEMQLGFDITGDSYVGDSVSNIIFNSTTVQIDSNADGLVDTTNDIPGLIKTSNGYYGLLSDTANVNVGNHKPFVMLESSAGVTWQPSLNYDISGISDVDSVNGGSTTVVIEKVEVMPILFIRNGFLLNRLEHFLRKQLP